MSLVSRLITWIFKLPPAHTHAVTVDRDLPIRMPDGTVLLADHYYPRGAPQPPTILIRTPYGRSSVMGLIFSVPYAERGFQVLIQSCRGTFGSEGEFNAFRNEREDGLATLEWLKTQPWFSGEWATMGPSYLGFVQWAIAADAGPGLKAMAPQVTASEFHSLTYAGEGFGLDTSLTWINLLRHQEDSFIAGWLARLTQSGATAQAATTLPLAETDRVATGERVPFYQDWLAHNTPGDPFWGPVDFSSSVERVSAPVHLTGGWYDIFLPDTLADYTRLRQARRQPYLTIGPWTHSAPAMIATAVRESLGWFSAHLLGDTRHLRHAPVRVYVMGANTWREFDQWPPDGFMQTPWFLGPNRRLALLPPPACPPDTFHYDPADPTPAAGGASLSRNAGPKDNRRLEARPDVLTYTTSLLERPVEIIGPLRVELYAKSSQAFTDFFARLCDVSPSGRSTNLSDGLLRLTPGRVPACPDGSLKVSFDLWPTAHVFLPGHAIRLQVSSGAHPRYVRNPGSGEPLASAVSLYPADQSIFHDPEHPSAVLLPVK